MSLKKVLETRKCFKLVCGAGNEDAVEVEKLVALYAAAGASYFDLSAKEDVVRAAFEGAKRAGAQGKVYFNVSVGIKGDPHVSKAYIDPEKCVACGKCMGACVIQRAITPGKKYKVRTMRCIGCGACALVCPVKAISILSEPEPLAKVLPPLIKLGLHSLELHAVTEDEETAFAQWSEMERYFGGMLSLCIDRSRVSDRQLVARVKRFIAKRPEFSTVIQADGAPMSGCDDREATTLQALGTAQIVDRASLPAFLMLSGGTNSKTARLAKLFGIKAHGVALGSYARKIVAQYVDREDFLSNRKAFSAALAVARRLVSSSVRYMG